MPNALDETYFAFIDELVVVAKRHKVLTVDRALVRDIGERLNARGGLPAMQTVESWIRDLYHAGEFGPPSEDAFHPAEIDAAWDGIGMWRW